MLPTTEREFRRIVQPHKILFVKKKNTAHAAQRWFCRVNRRQNESGVLRGGKFFRGLFLTEVVGLTVITNHFLWLCSKWTRPHLVDEFEPIHKINGIYKKNTTACRMRQEGFEKFIEVKQEKYNTSCSFRKKIRYVNQNKPHFLSAVDLSIAGSNRMLHFWPLSNNRCKKMQGENPSDG